MKSQAERYFEIAWALNPLKGADLVREHPFHPTRKWRFDFAFPSVKLAVEIDGRGRHQTVAGTRADCEKMNEAIILGWRVLRFPATDKQKARDWVIDVHRAIIGSTLPITASRSG